MTGCASTPQASCTVQTTTLFRERKVGYESDGRRRGGERRARILTAAAQIIADRGYHSPSLADIRDSASVVGPAIYRHFESKAGLLAALFEQSDRHAAAACFLDRRTEP
ncbi:helix-turn-helix domain-containing protein [Mycolicibacterium mucogenicum]|uniref:helix-turn-helix domain-containing protein n=1 Tax=Mycolicibacterium mucogenicum TaxID=56689 RepID=UPI002B40A2ED|nr:helix-turn-helix domain-containing protein [Mycolicibacterium mucogenicum]